MHVDLLFKTYDVYGENVYLVTLLQISGPPRGMDTLYMNLLKS